MLSIETRAESFRRGRAWMIEASVPSVVFGPDQIQEMQVVLVLVQHVSDQLGLGEVDHVVALAAFAQKDLGPKMSATGLGARL